MNELVHRALTILRGMWHRRWVGLGVAWIAAIIGVTVALRVPERYEATARVYVDTQTLLRPLMEGLSIQPSLDQQVVLISRTLISRPNIEKLVRMADLDLGIDNRSAAARDELVDALMRTVQLSGSAQNNIYQISYRNTNPERARRVVQSLLSIFIEQSLGDKRQDSRLAVKFVDEQIRHYEDNLKAAEGRVKDFRLKYLGVAGPSGPDYFARMSRLSSDIESTRLELRAAEESRDTYKRELAGEAPVLLTDTAPPVQAPVAVPVIDARLTALHGELDALQRRFTDEHPDVVAVKRNIAELEARRATEVAALNSGKTPARADSTADRNPVFQSLKVSLAEAEANVAALRSRLSSYEGQYAQLKTSARLGPQIEAEYAQLNRDYDIQKRIYESLLGRRQSATLGEGVQEAGGTQFRVIDPPRVWPSPLPPTRISLLLLAMAGALVAGIAAAFAAAELKPTFHDARSLAVVSRRPTLGMLSMLATQSLVRKRRRNTLLFAGGVSGLFASCMAVLAFTVLVTKAL
jgi:polysaccharide chain length determinant protein (PEP-CTERM system associated)